MMGNCFTGTTNPQGTTKQLRLPAQGTANPQGIRNLQRLSTLGTTNPQGIGNLQRLPPLEQSKKNFSIRKTKTKEKEI